MRGKLRKNLALNATVRITPAGAGKTGFLLPPPEAGRDHPRRCGENPRRQADRVELPVSPPQVRGKREIINIRPRRGRITPAGAGKTSQPALRHAFSQDHPRRCGENYKQSLTRCRRLGSPPQVRGKLRAVHRDFVAVEDHPRRCGENCADVPVQTGAKRITPAGAGKTRLQQRAQCQRRDHPRRCGENSAWGCIEYAHPGSPPQVRGKLPSSIASSILYRITPAGAGKTILEQNPLQELIGSPPQVRGKQSMKKCINGKIRITPAGAGKTQTRE